jgi:glycosyltransferase involved in cell wall biosynthesis
VPVAAFASPTAVDTCRDCGGPAELVVEGVPGKVCEPGAAGLATRLRELSDDAPLAERLGQAAFERGSAINWPDTVASLTGW